MTHTLGIDIGTTGTKIILLDADRGLVAQHSCAATLFSDHPGFAEADANQWLENIAIATREVMQKSGVPAAEVSALATSGMVPAVVLVGDNGRPVRRVILQNDARAVQEIDEITAELRGLDVTAITGSALTQQSIAPTIRWIRRNEPQAWSETRWLMGSYDWILHALGARPHVEDNWALESGLFTLDGDLLQPVLDAGGLTAAALPPVYSPGDVVGELSQTGADLLGLNVGTILVIGGADHVLSAFAAGVKDTGDYLVKLGGAGDILAASATPVVDNRLYLDRHPVPGIWLPNGCMAASGSLIRWYQAVIGGPDLIDMDHEAATRQPGEILCLPYFLGEKSPLHDPLLRGAFVGLHLGHTRADMYRSILEAIAFGFRHHLEVFREIGVGVTRAMVTNGGSKSTLWKQIHAEVLGTIMHPVRDHPGASLGAALLAAVGAGLITDWADTTKFLVLDDPVVPAAENIARYDEMYQHWRLLGSTLTPLSHSLASRSHV